MQPSAALASSVDAADKIHERELVKGALQTAISEWSAATQKLESATYKAFLETAARSAVAGKRVIRTQRQVALDAMTDIPLSSAFDREEDDTPTLRELSHSYRKELMGSDEEARRKRGLPIHKALGAMPSDVGPAAPPAPHRKALGNLLSMVKQNAALHHGDKTPAQ